MKTQKHNLNDDINRYVGNSNPQPSAYTPGPWTTDKDGRSVTTIPKPTRTMSVSMSGNVGEERTEMHASTIARCAGNSESRANARLIAVAPELLEALKLFVNEFNEEIGVEMLSKWNKLIAKAEGR